jgi:hypothetical protein
MDETCFQIGILARAWVIIAAGAGEAPYRTHPGRQEWISSLECRCADGSTVPPLFIFKGKSINTNLFVEILPASWGYSSSGEGWTTNTHGL